MPRLSETGPPGVLVSNHLTPGPQGYRQAQRDFKSLAAVPSSPSDDGRKDHLQQGYN